MTLHRILSRPCGGQAPAARAGVLESGRRARPSLPIGHKDSHAGHAVHPDEVIAIPDLAKSYGRKTRRQRPRRRSLTVRKGEVFGLLGRNGAGKTTLVRTLLGLLRPRRLQCASSDAIRSRPRDARRVGFSPEEPGFPRYLYPRQVLEYCGALSGLRGPALSQAVERELTRSELQQAANRQARQLSKGMKQRLSLAQAFLHAPSCSSSTNRPPISTPSAAARYAT